MVTAHISKNLRRYAVGAGATGAAALAAKPAGKQVGKASVGKGDPHYDMNRRAGESIFQARKQKIDSSRLKKRGLREAGSRTFGKGMGRITRLNIKPDDRIGKAVGKAVSKTLSSKPGVKQVVPAAATAAAAGIIGKRAKSGAEQGRYEKRRSGTQKGYTDAYKKTYGRQEGIDEGIVSKGLRAVGKNVAKGAGETTSSPAGRRKMRQAGHDAGSGAAEGAMKHLEKPLRQINRSVRVAGGSIGGGAAVGGIGIGAGQASRRKDRKEGINEANVAGRVQKISGKLKSIKARPGAQKAQSAIRWGGRGVAALDLAVLGAAGGVAGVKKIRGDKKREEGLDEAGPGSVVRAVGKSIQRHQDNKTVRYLNRNKSRRGANAVKVARRQANMDTTLKAGTAAGVAGVGMDTISRRKKREEGLTEGRIKGSGLRKVADKVGPQIQKADVGLFGISTGRAIKGKSQDVADDRQLNQSHLRRANNG